MRAGQLERWSGGAGIGFVVLLVGGVMVGFTSLAGAMSAAGGSTVMPDSAEQMVAVVSDARIGLGASAYLLSLAAVAFVWFSAGLATAVRRHELQADSGLWMLVLAGGVLYAAYLLGWVSVLTQGVSLATSDPAGGTAVDAMMRGPYDKIFWAADWMFPAILILGGTGLSARAGLMARRWLSRASLGLAAALVILGALALILLMPIAWLAFPVFLLIWIPWTSLLLLRGGGLAGRPTQAA